MRILILGGDGYLGWPTAMRFSQRGHDVHVVDNYLRRRAHAEAGTDSLTPILPDLATIDESGLPGFQAQQTYGLLAPAGTPAEIVKLLNGALQEALASDLEKARIAADGAEPAPGSPEDYAQDIDREETKWSKVVEEAGAKER